MSNWIDPYLLQSSTSEPSGSTKALTSTLLLGNLKTMTVIIPSLTPTICDLTGRFLSLMSWPTPQLSYHRNSLPLLTHALSLLFKKRGRLHQRAKTLNSPTAWLSYRKARNRAVSAIWSAKRKFFSNLSSLVKTPKEFWSAYHSLLPNQQRIPAMLSNGSVTAEFTTSKCEHLNCHFTKVFSNSNLDPTYNPPEPNPHLQSFRTSPVLSMKFFTCCPPFPGKRTWACRSLPHIVIIAIKNSWMYYLQLSFISSTY